jgi:hypothetical protein
VLLTHGRGARRAWRGSALNGKIDYSLFQPEITTGIPDLVIAWLSDCGLPFDFSAGAGSIPAIYFLRRAKRSINRARG